MHALTRPTEPGEIRARPARLLWIAGATVLGPVGALAFTTPSAVLVFALSTALLLCVGHSVGLHRGLIHGAFAMGPRTAGVLAYLAVQTGLGEPLGMMATHDLRDRWQGRARCPEYYGYAHAMLRDAWWYLCCEHVPRAGDLTPTVPLRFTEDPWLVHLERHWRAHVLASGVPLYWIGGPDWLVWGLGMRVFVSAVGHWLVNYLAHTRGEQPYAIEGAGEEGRNYRPLAALAMGEGWHNNHHAYPRSAQLGVHPGELDPGWVAVRCLARAGLIWDVIDAQRAGLRAGARRR